MGGWVYIITNEAMPGLLKVGYTERDPQDRARELTNEYKTGVPWDFVVEYALQTHDPKTLEKRVHLALEHFHENREWFRCSVKDARAAIAKEATFEERIGGEKFTRCYRPPLPPQPKKKPASHKPPPIRTQTDIVQQALQVLQETKPHDSEKSVPALHHNPPPPYSFVRECIRAFGLGWMIIVMILGVLAIWMGILSLMNLWAGR